MAKKAEDSKAMKTMKAKKANGSNTMKTRRAKKANAIKSFGLMNFHHY